MSLPVFFAPEMVAHPESFSPSAAKPQQVVDHWRALQLPIELHRPEPVTEQQIALAHDAAYVREVLSCARANGFRDRSPRVAASLPWTTGAMLSAARHALRTGGIACAPCSGFHHAHWDHNYGYCTFNGLMVTALALRAEGHPRIGILDCDMHFGDGTEDILKHLEEPSFVQHFTAGDAYDQPSQAEAFLARLPEIVRSMKDCAVLLYQAGADPHVDDPLGGWLTTEELRRRDEIVFREARALGLPVAWNLAGRLSARRGRWH